MNLGGRPQKMRLLRLEQWDQIALDEKHSQPLFFPPMSLYKAKPVLERGGIVVMAPDGDYGNSDISVPFHGRMLFSDPV